MSTPTITHRPLSPDTLAALQLDARDPVIGESGFLDMIIRNEVGE